MKRLRINKPSAADLASICGTYPMDNASRFGATSRIEPQRDRRLDFSRPRPSYFSSSQSQQSYSQGFSQSQTTELLSSQDLKRASFQPQPLCIRPQEDMEPLRLDRSERLEQRLSALEALVAGVAESLNHMRKELDNQNLKASIKLKEEEGAIKRLREHLQAVPAKLSEEVKVGLKDLKLEDLAQMVKEFPRTFAEQMTAQRRQLSSEIQSLLPKTLAEQIKALQRQLSSEIQSVLQSHTKKPPQPELIHIDSDDESVCKGPLKIEFEDLYGNPTTEKGINKMREKIKAARRKAKRRRI